MRCSIHERFSCDWFRCLGVSETFQLYLRRQLYRRGFRTRARLDEALTVAAQRLAVELLCRDSDPVGWQDWRRLLDRAVHQAKCELRSCGTVTVDLDILADSDDEFGRQTALEWALEVADLVERLPVPQRLVVKLKLADWFCPAWEVEYVSWTSDEVDHLLAIHPDRSLEDLNAEFRARLESTVRRHRGKVPSAVMAWLLGRASADAVDTAFLEIKEQLRNAAPEGAAGVSKVVEPTRSPRHTAPAVLLSRLVCRRSLPPWGQPTDHSPFVLLLRPTSPPSALGSRSRAA
jgi:hypothetical protein